MQLPTETMFSQSLGASLLGSLGSIMIELGQMAIGIGLGLKSIKLALATLNPFVAIAVGGALIALGSMFASGSRKLSQSMGSGGGGGLFICTHQCKVQG